MDQAAQILDVAHQVFARANDTCPCPPEQDSGRPPTYKAIGISLAIGSGLFIGVSFVLKKVGLLKANEKYSEVAGEGYGYLKNAYWWGGMTLMILGEVLNFAAYAFTDAILVTSLGAISVVVTTVLSAIFLKERLSLIGKVSCFLCVVGAIVIVLNAPESSSVSTIQEFKDFVIAPGFLSYTGVVILGALFAAFWLAPRYGNKNMFTYISICSWIGGLSVVSTQGLGAAIVAQAGGTPQFNQWFLYIVLVFVVGTLLTEIIYLNKALNLYNAAMVTPTYYVYFTSTTIITSAILFRGFHGTAQQLITVVLGFLTICSGVILLQLSKSAKDVPDTAVFAGDLNQIQTIAEQEQPETEPKADALRGAAAIMRWKSVARQKMEENEFKRLREEKEKERLAPVSEDGHGQYEWDGLRRRRTTLGSDRRPLTASTIHTPAHPPLGRTRLITEEELEEERNRQMSPGVLSSIAGTIRSRARSVLGPGPPELPQHGNHGSNMKMQSPMHPVQLTDINVPNSRQGEAAPYSLGLPPGLRKTEYEGAASVASSSTDRHIQFTDVPKPGASVVSLAPPTPPPHGEQARSARRQFSFQNVFRRHQADREQEHPPSSSLSASELQPPPPRHGLRSRGYSNREHKLKDVTEEERLGLVQGDSRSMPSLPHYGETGVNDDDDDDNDEEIDSPYSDEKRAERFGRGVTNSPPRTAATPRRRGSEEDETLGYDESQQRWNQSQTRSRDATPPRPPPSSQGGGRGAFL